MNTKELQSISKNIRREIIEMVHKAKSSHVGCALSSADILATLYFKVMNIDPKFPDADDRDLFVMSKGHGVTALYATLAERGFFDKEKIREYGKDGTRLASHTVKEALPGIEVSAGSGGHGHSLASGMALAAKNKGSDVRVFLLSGDGELQEGSAWEALLFAGFHTLNNITMVIDRNDFQDGKDGLRVSQILDLDPLDEKLKSFRWNVVEVDGHNFDELISAFSKKTDRPLAIIANTVKGRGVSFMEGDGKWHGSTLTDEEYETAIDELS